MPTTFFRALIKTPMGRLWTEEEAIERVQEHLDRWGLPEDKI
jgi:hypothetical protein